MMELWPAIVTAVVSLITGVLGTGGAVKWYSLWRKARQEDAVYIADQYRKLLEDERGTNDRLRDRIFKLEAGVETARKRHAELLTDRIELQGVVNRQQDAIALHQETAAALKLQLKENQQQLEELKTGPDNQGERGG